ncbi:MAG: hypothetical protein WD595_04035 [Waddliaceae bacterium]
MLTIKGGNRLAIQKLKLQEQRPIVTAFGIAFLFHFLMITLFQIQTIQPGDVESVFVPSWIEQAEYPEMGVGHEEEIDPLFGFPFNEGHG